APALPLAFSSQQPAPVPAAAPVSSFPQQESDLVREIVTVAHGNLARVKERVTARPASARAQWAVFTAVMMGHLAVVKGFVEAAPGIQRTRGVHGLTFVSHARAGGPPAAGGVEAPA